MDLEYLYKELIKLQQIVSLTKTYHRTANIDGRSMDASRYYSGLAGRCMDSAVEKIKTVKGYVRARMDL